MMIKMMIKKEIVCITQKGKINSVVIRNASSQQYIVLTIQNKYSLLNAVRKSAWASGK